MTAYLVAHTLPLETEREPHPVVLASISTDKKFVGSLNVERELRALAGKMGIFDFIIHYGDPQGMPGEQLHIPFPVRRR